MKILSGIIGQKDLSDKNREKCPDAIFNPGTITCGRSGGCTKAVGGDHTKVKQNTACPYLGYLGKDYDGDECACHKL